MSYPWLVIVMRQVCTSLIDNLAYYRNVEDIIEYYRRPGRNVLPRSMISLRVIVTLILLRGIILAIAFFLSHNAQIVVFSLSILIGGDPNHRLVFISLHLLSIVLYLRLYPLLYHDRHYLALLVVKKVIERANTCTDIEPSCVYHRIRKVLQCFQYSRSCILVIFVFSYMLLQYVLWDEHLRADEKLTLTFVVKIICIEVNSLFAFSVLYFVFTIFWDGMLLIFIFSIFAFEQLRCYEQRYLPPKENRFTVRSLKSFIVRHNRTFRLILSVNEIFSDTFLLTLLVVYPVNSYLLVHLIVDRFQFLNVVFRSLYVSQSYNYIFFVHLLAVMHSLRIHHFTKSMFHHSFHLHATLSARLRMSHYLERFHTRKKYGFTYSKFGSISFNAFTKFLFIYIRFLFFFYKRAQIEH